MGASPVGGVDARSLAAIRGVTLAVKVLPRELRNTVNREVRANLNPIWREELSDRLARMPAVDAKVLGSGARVKPGTPASVTASAGTRPLSGGLVPNLRGKGWEFGTDDREGYKTYTRRNRRNAGSHRITRRTKRHLPRRTPEGRAIWPAFAQAGPRLISLQVQTIVRTINDGLGN